MTKLSLHISGREAIERRATTPSRVGEKEQMRFARRYLDPAAPQVKILSARGPHLISLLAGDVRGLVNEIPVNNIYPINDYFRAANEVLGEGGVLVGSVMTIGHRRETILSRYPAGLAEVMLVFDFLLHRVLPRLPYVGPIFVRSRRGPHRGLSLTECLGRLVYCGFHILDFAEDDEMTHFAARVEQPPLTGPRRSYGPIFSMTRVGKGGRPIRVYKIRTMHPYSEYLQDFIYDRNSIASDGKFREDFRVTRWGRLFRKTWLDELPMILNWLKRDLKLVGVRPLSNQYLALYPETVRAKRMNTKPGLIPPYYADLPTSFDEIVASEDRYLDAFDRRPVRTDLRYLALTLYNILFRRARSR